MAQRIIRRAALEGAIAKPVSCLTLRHSCAVAMRRHGAHVREVQACLGHQRVQTTMRYDRCILPPGIVSPADRLSMAAIGLAGTPRPPGESAVPSAPLAAPLPPETWRLLPVPFAPAGAAEFYAQLRTRAADRFLALRAAFTMTG